jgi:serine/arginine repetitive matrix protein 2
MYNGVGLKTARGSGTSGYIQRNLSFAKPFASKRAGPGATDLGPPKAQRKPSLDLLLHQHKRQIEVECLEYEEELRDSKEYTEEVIKEKVNSHRRKQLARLEASLKQYVSALLHHFFSY